MGILSLFHHAKASITKSNAKGSKIPVSVPTCQVLFVNGCDLETLSRYRVSHQREQLELWGITTDEIHYTSVDKGDAYRADIFIVYRCPLTEQVEQLIESAHQLGKKVYFDVDDIVISTTYTDGLPVVANMTDDEKLIFDDGVIRTGMTLAMCDGAIATTERLASELSKVVPTVFINRNVASLEMVSHSESAIQETSSRAHEICLGYFSGSMTHNRDFELILPALASVMQKRPNVKLKIVGDLELPPEFAPLQNQILRADKVSWQELPSLIASVDINLAPIEATLFNEAKSENKWMEAALVKVPTIASSFGAFARMIQDGITGMLCSSTAEWEQSLLKLIDDKDLREGIGTNAYLFCHDNCTTAETGYKLARFLFDIPTDIEHLLPTSSEYRQSHVGRYLRSRGIATPDIDTSFDIEPWNSISLKRRIETILEAKERGVSTAAFIYERNCGDIATFRYFGYNICQRLKSSQQWHAVYFFIDEIDAAQRALSACDVLVFIRCRIRPELLQLAERAKERSIRIAYLIDDNALGTSTAPHIIKLMATDPDSDFEQRFWQGVTKRLALASELADCLIVPNDYFADLLRKQTDVPVFVLHSSINDEQVGVSDSIERCKDHKLDNRFIVGYFSGTSSHQNDFLLVESAVIDFIQSHDDAALLIGGSFILDERLLELHEKGKVVVMPRVDYVTLQSLQASVDVVLAPLVVDDFTNCKSALKVFEAGVVGTPACASPTFSYSEAIQNDENGYLCQTPEDWRSALESIYSDKDKRAILGREARRAAINNYYGAAVSHEAECALEHAKATLPHPIPDRLHSLLQRHSHLDWDDPFVANTAFGSK